MLLFNDVLIDVLIDVLQVVISLKSILSMLTFIYWPVLVYLLADMLAQLTVGCAVHLLLLTSWVVLLIKADTPPKVCFRQ